MALMALRRVSARFRLHADQLKALLPGGPNRLDVLAVLFPRAPDLALRETWVTAGWLPAPHLRHRT